MQVAKNEMQAIVARYKALMDNKGPSRRLALREIADILRHIDELEQYCKYKHLVGKDYKALDAQGIRRALVRLRADINATEIAMLPDAKDTLRTCPKCQKKLKCIRTYNYPKQIERVVVCKSCGYSIVTVERLGGDYGNNEE